MLRRYLPLIEALLIFAVVFLPGIGLPSDGGGYYPFSVHDELSQLFLYDIPALGLVAFLFLRDRGLRQAKIYPVDWKNLWRILLVFSILCAIAELSMLPEQWSSASSESAIGMALGKPEDAIGWIVLSLACLFAAYLEETYFRAYLLTRFREANVAPVARVAFAALLFCVCHLYEGWYGLANAFGAGIALGVLYEKDFSVHELAFAHAAYNVFTYLTVA